MREKLGYIIVSDKNETPQVVYNYSKDKPWSASDDLWSAGTSDISEVTFFSNFDDANNALRALETIRTLGRKIKRAEIKLHVMEL